jgi:hypothetical protein
MAKMTKFDFLGNIDQAYASTFAPSTNSTPEYNQFMVLPMWLVCSIKVGPLMHRQNELEDSISDMYVRSHYNIL